MIGLLIVTEEIALKRFTEKVIEIRNRKEILSNIIIVAQNKEQLY